MFISDSFSTSIAQNAAAASQNGNASVAPSSESPRLHKLRQAAAEFEGMLISSLWKSMKSSFADPDEDDSADPAHDTLNDLSVNTMSNAVAKAGGFGLSKLILKRLEPMLAHSQPENLSVSGKASASSADISSE